MSEFLNKHPESLEDGQELDLERAQLAAESLSRAIKESEDYEGPEDYEGHDDEDDYNESEDYEDYDDDEEDDYYEDYEDEEKEELTLQEIPLPNEILERYSFLNELPHGVAVMGGVARSIAREIITGEREPIRDIDLVNILDENDRSEVDGDTLDALSQKFMPDDYAFGHGINHDTLDNYFRTRDFTINQSLIMDKKLIVSNLAYDDFQENIIRPTRYEHHDVYEPMSSRLFLKALMMRSVLLQISDSVPLLEDIEMPDFIKGFDVALFLNKAMSRGAETACTFTRDLADWGVVTEEFRNRPIALARDLLEDIYSFEFRASTDERFDDIQECDDMDGYFVPSAMSQYHASDPAIRDAIAEYEGMPDEHSRHGEERLSGNYTQAEYDYINEVSA